MSRWREENRPQVRDENDAAPACAIGERLRRYKHMKEGAKRN